MDIEKFKEYTKHHFDTVIKEALENEAKTPSLTLQKNLISKMKKNNPKIDSSNEIEKFLNDKK